jgi:hypothetical protein
VSADFSTYKVASAETSDATKFDAFVQAVQDALNAIGDTTKMNWSSGQIIALSQMSQSGASSARCPPGTGRRGLRRRSGRRLCRPGMVAAYAGSSAPSGWLLCDGTAVSRTTYSALFAAIGTSYGAGDGSTTFNLPDLRGRVPVGKPPARPRGRERARRQRRSSGR